MHKPLLLVLVLMAHSIAAQWTTPPDAPLTVCDAANEQTSVRALSDGADGWYVFWRDGRVSNAKREIYGQHLSAAGVALWEPNGRQLVADPVKTITNFAFDVLPDGEFLLLWSQGATSGDTLKAMLFGNDGLPQWTDAALVAGKTNNNAYSLGHPRVVVQESQAFVAWAPVHQGSNPVVAYGRLLYDGTVLDGFNGTYVPNSGYGTMYMASDGNGGVFLTWATANASGAGIRAQHVNSEGQLHWAAQAVPTAGTVGMNDSYRAVADGQGAVVIVWNGADADLHMSRVDTTGAFTWSPAVKPVCLNSSQQHRPALCVQDGHIYAAWSDARPPANNSDLYAQKFDMDGEPLWTVDGVRAIRENSYIPHALLAPTPDGGLYVAHKTNGGFKAMLLNSDGAPLWDPAFAMSTATLAPNYDDQRMLATAVGNAVLFWSTNADNIHATTVTPTSGISTGIGVVEHQGSGLSIYPNPANDPLNITMNDAHFGKEAVIELFDATGKRVHAHVVPSVASNVLLELPGALCEGLYLAMLRVEGQAPASARVIIRR